VSCTRNAWPSSFGSASYRPHRNFSRLIGRSPIGKIIPGRRWEWLRLSHDRPKQRKPDPGNDAEQLIVHQAEVVDAAAAFSRDGRFK
jgi:hypothetical protein